MRDRYSSEALTGLALAFTISLLFGFVHWRSRPALPLPPGPPAEFLLGHTRIIPKQNASAVYAQWSKDYDSDVIHVRSLGRSTVVLNSMQAARDILDKKGANFCDRPRFTLLEVMGWGRTLTFLPFGERWQMHRKLLQTSFSNTNVRQWYELQINEARRTVCNMMNKPETWETSLRRLAVAIVLQVSYGTEVPKDDDPYIKIANDAMYATGNGGVPANSVVDLVPLGKEKMSARTTRTLKKCDFGCANGPWIVRHLPDWIVRDWSLRFARQWRWAIKKLHDIPFAAAQTEHTWATCVIFILNMVLHPEIQEKARRQLDEVIGSDRLPTFSDRASLPYIEHIVQEIYRTVVYANAYAMAHDERIYRSPHEFNPDRYGAGEPFPVGNFGFGRRVCVGRFLADNSVWIMVATMLATLQFCKRIASDGTPVEPRVRFTNGGTWSVNLSPLPCITPTDPLLRLTLQSVHFYILGAFNPCLIIRNNP
ncbi:hypothetical protein NW762_001686 [Fusarium torreyae]|uniref:Cytochrome P450 n=1 Tax=Fusarium torreyae TaxID=1237075 RepID=A0A9W8SEB0_9HYPO|nr:hypothetical protein NW762_001686 [Fusarium torreyae]